MAACLAGFVLLAVVRSDENSKQIGVLSSAVRKAESDLAAFRGVCDRQRALLSEREGELARSGQLPAQTPIERYFQTLSEMASRYELNVNRQHPLSPRNYAGLLEQRYAYELNGTTENLLKLFRAVEGADFWADIGFLKIECRGGAVDGASTDRTASLTISLFSALPDDGAADGG